MAGPLGTRPMLYLTTEPKVNSDAVVINCIYSKSYVKSTLCRYVRIECWPVTLPPLFKDVITLMMDDGKPF